MLNTVTKTTGKRRRAGETRFAIYDFLIAYTDDHGFPPTLREICDAVGLASPATAAQHLKKLEADHMISRQSNRARAVAPLRLP